MLKGDMNVSWLAGPTFVVAREGTNISPANGLQITDFEIGGTEAVCISGVSTYGAFELADEEQIALENGLPASIK